MLAWPIIDQMVLITLLAALYLKVLSSNLLHSMLTGDAKHLADIKAIVVLDLFSHVGEMMAAFPAVRSNYKAN